MAANKVTESHEDYLEAVVMLGGTDKIAVRPVDVANKLGVSKASVNKAVSVLKEAGMLDQPYYGDITLTQDGYEDALGVAYTSLLDSVQSRGERFQGSGRPLIFLTDEGHLITTNELLGPKIAKGTKMWRKLDTWFWLATQNLKDFPGSMERVLSMCEYWMLLTMDKAEIEEVSRFRQLTREQRLMMESARKEPPKYTEGVLISADGQVLFRNVPPALPIALAMTEGHEKAHRKRLMDEHGCSEMEAAFMVARQLEEKRA